MSEIMEIVQLGNPLLRKISSAVSFPLSEEFLRLLDDMSATLANAAGAGLAAPQIGYSVRVFVMNYADPETDSVRLLEVINPEIHEASESVHESWEGCLSIPGIRGIVKRHQNIKVSFADRAGVNRELHLTDFNARVFQHEYDHLDGLVYIDRMETVKYLVTEKEYIRIIEESDDEEDED